MPYLCTHLFIYDLECLDVLVLLFLPSVFSLVWVHMQHALFIFILMPYSLVYKNSIQFSPSRFQRIMLQINIEFFILIMNIWRFYHQRKNWVICVIMLCTRMSGAFKIWYFELMCSYYWLEFAIIVIIFYMCKIILADISYLGVCLFITCHMDEIWLSYTK